MTTTPPHPTSDSNKDIDNPIKPRSQRPNLPAIQQRNSPNPTPYLPSTSTHTTPHLALPFLMSIPPPLNPAPQHQKLHNQISILQCQLTQTQTQLDTALSTLQQLLPPSPSPNSDADPDKTTLTQAQTLLKAHIRLLHQYNEIKDIGLGLMGLIAEKDGRRLGDVMEDFGVDEED